MMNWFGEILYNPPPSTARELRDRGRRGSRMASSMASSTSQAPAEPEEAEEDETVPDRIHRVVHGESETGAGYLASSTTTQWSSSTTTVSKSTRQDEYGEEEDEEDAEHMAIEDGDHADAEGMEDVGEDEEDGQLADTEGAGDDMADAQEDEEAEEEEEAAEEGGDEEAEAEEDEFDLSSASFEQLMKLTAVELRSLLSERKLPSYGIKAEMATRLLEFAKKGSLDGQNGEDAEEAEDDEEVEIDDGDDTIPEHSKSLSLSIHANRSATDMFSLNERLHDILENEVVKDKQLARLQAELQALRAQHQKDLDELGFAKDLRTAESEFHAIVEELRELTEREESAVDEVSESCEELRTNAEETANKVEELRKTLKATVEKGNELEDKVQKLAETLSAAVVKKRKQKVTTTSFSSHAQLLEVALSHVTDEHDKHDPQRVKILNKLDDHVTKLKNENEHQVNLMHEHSNDIIQEAREHLERTYENRARLLKEKYGALQELLASQAMIGDDALAKHREYVEEQYQAYIEERTTDLKHQVEETKEDCAHLESERSTLKEEVDGLMDERRKNEADLAKENAETKNLQAQSDQLIKEITDLQDKLHEARLDLEEAERKEKKIEVDYDILMVENSHLTEEIDRFGALIQNAETGLSRSSAFAPIPEEPAAASEDGAYATPKPRGSRKKRASSRKSSSTGKRKGRD